MEMKIMEENLRSIQSAVGLSVMKKAMGQDSQTVAALLTGMEAANAKTLEASVTPHKGAQIDLSV